MTNDEIAFREVPNVDLSAGKVTLTLAQYRQIRLDLRALGAYVLDLKHKVMRLEDRIAALNDLLPPDIETHEFVRRCGSGLP